MPASKRPKIPRARALSAKWNVVVADWTLYDIMLDANEWLFASRKAADAFEPGAKAIVYLLSRAGLSAASRPSSRQPPHHDPSRKACRLATTPSIRIEFRFAFWSEVDRFR